MKCRTCSTLLGILILIIVQACADKNLVTKNVRVPVDTIGFAQYDWQMDKVMDRINDSFADQTDSVLLNNGIDANDAWKAAISPHDDYAYAGKLYPLALRNIKANTVFLIGVAHKARIMALENQIIFDSFDAWKGPYGNVSVSDMREEVIQQLPLSLFQVNDSMQRMEHSLEALIPFLQYQNRELEIVPILVPYMSFEKMNGIAIPLAEAIYKITQDRQLTWGRDFAIVISNDAVHYGDAEWGGKDFARYGADSAGYLLALQHEMEVIQTLSNALKPEKIRQFCNYTVQDDDFKAYKWTWCGRYSVPFGLLTAFHLNHMYRSEPLYGIPLDYSTSIENDNIQVDDLQMGVTAPASIRHWVGYAAIGYK